MSIDGTKYIGMHLDGISIDSQTFTVNLSRYTVPAAQAASLDSLAGRARMIFCLRDSVSLSNVSSGAEMLGIKQRNDGQGRLVCTLNFSLGGYIRIAAGNVIDFAF